MNTLRGDRKRQVRGRKSGSAQVSETTTQTELVWPVTEEAWCAWFRQLDIKYATEPRSPLHHDNRCTLHLRAR